MIELGLQRISRLLAPTPLPWRAIHVAGTNGKGSVCAYISEMLNTYNRSRWRQTEGHPVIRHGRFTSPHIVDRWDCISLSQGDAMHVVDEAFFLETEGEVMKRNREMKIGASEFELLTATAFEVFTRNKLDIAVIETGMGGRLDATNIIGQLAPHEDGSSSVRPLPLVTAITKVGLDHQGFLGDTVEAIALEKAGIFKTGAPALWDESNKPSVIEVLQTEAKKKGCQVTTWANQDLHPNAQQKVGDGFNASASTKHAVENASVAFLAAWTALSAMGIVGGVPEQANARRELLDVLIKDLTTAPRRVRFPGRLEWIDVSPLVGSKIDPLLLDGAHNAQSAEVLAATVAELRTIKAKQTIWVIAASDTKDVKEILSPLLAPGDSVFAVEFGDVDGMPWVSPMKASSILSAAQHISPDLSTMRDYGTNILAALQAACSLREESLKSGTPANVVIAGSLYLVGDVHRLLRNAHT